MDSGSLNEKVWLLPLFQKHINRLSIFLVVLYMCNFTLEIPNFLMHHVNLPMLVVKLLSLLPNESIYYRSLAWPSCCRFTWTGSFLRVQGRTRSERPLYCYMRTDWKTNCSIWPHYLMPRQMLFDTWQLFSYYLAPSSQQKASCRLKLNLHCN